jgi:hypothetical protein
VPQFGHRSVFVVARGAVKSAVGASIVEVESMAASALFRWTRRYL